MGTLSFLMAILAAFLSLSFAIATSLSVFEKAPGTGSWVRGDRAARSSVLHLQIVLHKPRAGEFEQLATDIATPGHEQYGKHLSREQIRDFLQPSSDSIEDVQSWLEDNYVSSNKYRLTESADTINLKITVGDAEELLETEFHTYTDDGHTITRSEKYSLPDALHEHILTVMPIIRFPEIKPHMSTMRPIKKIMDTNPYLESDPEFCNNTMTPSCLRQLYQMGDFQAPLNSGTVIGVSGYLNASFLVDDLHGFIAAYASYCPQIFPVLYFIVPPGSTQIPNLSPESPRELTGEAALDTQYAASMAPGIPLSLYFVAGHSETIPDADTTDTVPASMFNEPYDLQLSVLLNLPDDKLPSVLTTSYGENDQTVPVSYQNFTCNLYAALGARGVSIIFSSGDTGPGSSCTSNGQYGTTYGSARFNPIFPATCPFVTSVGGTTGIGPERASSFSGGGFSMFFQRPAWQNASVNSYLEQLGDKWKGLYELQARGFPDVAIQSENFVVRDHGEFAGASGTSAGAPVFAAMIANLNAVRISKGLPKLGFLNPWLYGEARDAFTDITEGGSVGCTGITEFGGNGTYIPYASWNATEGWDPVTGLGTPIWPKLLQYATEGASFAGGDENGDQAVDDVDAAAAKKESAVDSLGDGPWDPTYPRPSDGSPHRPHDVNGTWGRWSRKLRE